MTEKDRILHRLLTQIQEHGYVHQVDRAAADWCTTNASVAELCEKYQVSPAALYKHTSRLRRKEVSASVTQSPARG